MEELNFLEKFKIIYKEEEIDITKIDEILINIINESFNNDKKNNYILIDDYELLIVYILVFIGIQTYYKNMINPDNNILKMIEKGRKVCYKNTIAVYDGVWMYEGKNRIKLIEDKKNLITYIDEKDAFKLTIYNGNSSRINKLKGDVNNSNITKNFIDKLFNCGINNLNGFINESCLIVFPKKEEILDIIESIIIEFEEDKILLTELIPMSYWKNSYNQETIKNRRKEDPIFNITCKMTNVRDLTIDNENIKKVLIFTNRLFSDYLETELRDIEQDYNIDKLVVFGKEEFKDTEYFLDDINNYEIYALTRNYILENINFNNKKKLTSLQKRTLNLLENKVKKRIEINYIKENELFDKYIKEVLSLVKKLLNYSSRDYILLDFIRSAYSLTNFIEYTILPLKFCKDSKEYISLIIDKISKIRDSLDKSRVEYSLMNEIINIFSKLINSIYNNNYKLSYIKSIVKSTNKSYKILIKNRFECKILKDFFKHKGITNVEFEKISRKVNFENKANVIMPFYQDYYNVFSNILLSNVILICHKREYERYKKLMNEYIEVLNKLQRSNNLISKNNKINLNIKDNFKSSKEEISIDSVNNEEEEGLCDLDNSIEECIRNDFANLVLNNNLYSYGVGNFIAKKLVVFNNFKYAFLSENYEVNVIDRDENTIKIKSIKDIKIGDEMIFILNNNGSSGIVKETIKKLLEDNEFSNKYKEYFIKNLYWKKKIKQYMEENDFSLIEFAEKFKNYGQTIHPLTISNWLNGTIVGPGNKKTFFYISEIIKDKELEDNINSYIDACRSVRSIQIKVTKAIAKIILNSFVNTNFEEGTIESYVSRLIKDINDYTAVCKVIYTKDIEKEVGAQYINKLNEGDE